MRVLRGRQFLVEPNLRGRVERRNRHLRQDKRVIRMDLADAGFQREKEAFPSFHQEKDFCGGLDFTLKPVRSHNGKALHTQSKSILKYGANDRIYIFCIAGQQRVARCMRHHDSLLGVHPTGCYVTGFRFPLAHCGRG